MTDKTQRALLEAFRNIETAQRPCDAPVPQAPLGRVFEKENIAVSITTGQATGPIEYNADCQGDVGWHYDNVDNPTRLRLCESSCKSLSAAAADLRVELRCQQVIDLGKSN